MRLAIVLVLAGLFSAPTAIAGSGEDDAHAIAEKRLRGCLLAGASTAPRTSLGAAIASTRAFCGPQINDLSDIRVREATQGLSDEDAAEAKKRILRQLNNEIAFAIADFTGLAE